MNDPLRPSRLDEFVGQEQMLARLRTHVDAAALTLRPLPHLLLCAPAGMGKTALAHVLGDWVGDPVHTLPMPADVRDLEEIVRRESGVLYVADLEEAGRAVASRLVSLLDYAQVRTARGRVHNDRLSVIAATAGRAPSTLYHRFMVPSWEPYTPEQMARIVAGMAAKAGVGLAADTLSGLGRAANGTPGAGRRLVLAAEALVMAGREPTLDAVLEQAGYALDGMTDAHIAFLEALDVLGGIATPAVLSLALRLHQSVCLELERALLDRHFIDLNRGSREITRAGRQRLRESRERSAAA